MQFICCYRFDTATSTILYFAVFSSFHSSFPYTERTFSYGGVQESTITKYWACHTVIPTVSVSIKTTYSWNMMKTAECYQMYPRVRTSRSHVSSLHRLHHVYAVRVTTAHGRSRGITRTQSETPMALAVLRLASRAFLLSIRSCHICKLLVVWAILVVVTVESALL